MMVDDENSTHNYTEHFNMKDHPLESFTLLVSSSICACASALYLFLIKKKLSGLNSIIKSILYFMAGGSFISNLIAFVNLILMFFWQLQNFPTCTMNRIITITNYFHILISLALISQVRYYIAVKTSQIKTYKKKTLQIMIATIYLLTLSVVIIAKIIDALYGSAPIITKCSGSADIDNTKYQFMLMIHGPLALLIVIINLIGDISMLIFIRKRKSQVFPVQLIPWKSVSKSEDDDLAVPVHATALSVVSLIILLLTIAILTILDYSLVLVPVLVIALSRLWINVVIPYVMLFKIIKTKKPKPIIPKGLQMHEEENGNANEYNDVNEENNETANSVKNDQQKYGETNSRSNSLDFSNEVILNPIELKFDKYDCIDEHMELT